MGFIMDGLDAESYDRTYSDRALVRRILDYFRPQLRGMLLVAGLVTLTSVMQAALPILLSAGLDELDVANPTFTGTIWGLLALIVITGVLSWVFNYIRQRQSAKVVGDVVLKLRIDAFKAITKRDMSFFDEVPSGRIVSRVTSDTEDFANTVTLSMNLVSQLLLVLIVTAALFTRDVRLTLYAVTIAPVIVVMALGFRRLARKWTQLAQRAVSNVNNTVQEVMSGISVAKSFRQEETIYHEFREINQQSYRVTLRQGWVFSSIFPLLFLVAGLGTTLLVYAGGHAVIDGDVSAGDWLLFLNSIMLFWFPLTSIASFWSQFQQGLSAAERVFALVDATPRVVQRGAHDPGPLKGRIEFEDVDFAYVDGQPVLKDFTLTIPAGQMVALVGHTGAGKSTLGKLITRFYEFQDGQLLIDGHDIRFLDLARYRRQVGVVPQTPFLFSGTVADNIRYPRPDASDEDVARAAAQIAGGDWVDALPDGLQTEIGERGRGLSMGQRQLVALARVLIQDPAIIILDEATASVDPLTEAQIQEGLDVVLAGRTSIVIAHRLSTIRYADRIIVLDHGRIVEEGTHESLLEAGGRYATLYQTYFRHQSVDYAPWMAGSGSEPVP
jgi:ABC-type multidrug transport system fused ATPase/permease subunit